MPFSLRSGKGKSRTGGSVHRISPTALSFGLAVCFGIAVSSYAAGQQEQKTAHPATEGASAAVAAAAPVNSTESSAAVSQRVVRLTAEGVTGEVSTAAHTVGELLAERGIKLSKLDRVSVPLSTPLAAGMEITVTRIRIEKVAERTPLPFSTRKQFTSRLPFGQTKTVRAGVRGERVKVFRVTYKDNIETARVKLSETNRPAKPAYVLAGTRGMTFSAALASRGYFTGRRILQMEATGYGPMGRGITASGLRAGYGVVAVDPRFIPLGTRLYVEGYGYAVAGDTGSAIKGNRIDLGFDSYREAVTAGRRKIRVLILN